MKKTIAVIALIAAPALASAQAGLSKIQFLALQQELRDQGCGVTNVDGHYGPQTRRAIATCAKKFNSANNAAALLTAMNIGFGEDVHGKTSEAYYVKLGMRSWFGRQGLLSEMPGHFHANRDFVFHR
jgi:peptidoglycan hydrolase-like protein with peptidoglycan-binding domain